MFILLSPGSYDHSSSLEDCGEDWSGSGMTLARVWSTEPPDRSAPEMPRLRIDSFAWRSAIRSPPLVEPPCGQEKGFESSGYK